MAHRVLVSVNLTHEGLKISWRDVLIHSLSSSAIAETVQTKTRVSKEGRDLFPTLALWMPGRCGSDTRVPLPFNFLLTPVGACVVFFIKKSFPRDHILIQRTPWGGQTLSNRTWARLHCLLLVVSLLGFTPGTEPDPVDPSLPGTY